MLSRNAIYFIELNPKTDWGRRLYGVHTGVLSKRNAFVDIGVLTMMLSGEFYTTWLSCTVPVKKSHKSYPRCAVTLGQAGVRIELMDER